MVSRIQGTYGDVGEKAGEVLVNTAGLVAIPGEEGEYPRKVSNNGYEVAYLHGKVWELTGT